MKRFTRAITRWGWLPPVLIIAFIIAVAGTVSALALTGDSETVDKAVDGGDGQQQDADAGPESTTTTIPPPDADELCQTIADEGYALAGSQVLATLEGAGTQVRAGDAEAAAEAYLTALSADTMLVGDAELVYQAMGIHPSRILGSSSEDVDPAHELELIRADAEHRDEVCEQTVLEAQESLETGELVHVTLSEQASFNMLVHDEANEMLPRWVCQVPLPEEGIDVLGFAQFVDLETGDSAEKVMWSLTQRAYVSFGACPEGGVAADGEFEAVLVSCEEGQELVERECVEVASTPSSTPDAQTGGPDDTGDDTGVDGGGSQDDDGDETGNGGEPGGGPDTCTDAGPTCPGPGPGGGGEEPGPCTECPGPSGGEPEPPPCGECPPTPTTAPPATQPPTTPPPPETTTTTTTTPPPTTAPPATQPPTTTVPPPTTAPPTTAPRRITVCDLQDQTVKTITEAEYNANPSRYIRDWVVGQDGRCKEPGGGNF